MKCSRFICILSTILSSNQILAKSNQENLNYMHYMRLVLYEYKTLYSKRTITKTAMDMVYLEMECMYNDFYLFSMVFLRT